MVLCRFHLLLENVLGFGLEAFRPSCSRLVSADFIQHGFSTVYVLAEDEAEVDGALEQVRLASVETRVLEVLWLLLLQQEGGGVESGQFLQHEGDVGDVQPLPPVEHLEASRPQILQ